LKARVKKKKGERVERQKRVRMGFVKKKRKKLLGTELSRGGKISGEKSGGPCVH